MHHILIVDDSPTIRRMVRASLSRFFPAAEFTEAASGLEAIERLSLHATGLMVLDLNMPDMHGVEVLQFVRSHQKFRDVPIIVLTTRGDDASRAAAVQAGATVYMTKPFVPEMLADEARKLLGVDEVTTPTR
jgi:two-component system chemotaxis response regulator CheY